MRINVARLQKTPGEELELNFIYEPAAEDLDRGMRLLRPVDVHLRLRSGRQGVIWLTAELKVEAAFTCDRCLRTFERQLSGEYMEEYRLRGAQDPAEEDDGEVRIVYYRGSEIDTGEGVRQNVLLLMPTKHLCMESCEGLCPVCGHDLNTGPCGCDREVIDPRLEILQQFKIDSKGSGE